MTSPTAKSSDLTVVVTVGCGTRSPRSISVRTGLLRSPKFTVPRSHNAGKSRALPGLRTARQRGAFRDARRYYETLKAPCELHDADSCRPALVATYWPARGGLGGWSGSRTSATGCGEYST